MSCVINPGSVLPPSVAAKPDNFEIEEPLLKPGEFIWNGLFYKCCISITRNEYEPHHCFFICKTCPPFDFTMIFQMNRNNRECDIVDVFGGFSSPSSFGCFFCRTKYLIWDERRSPLFVGTSSSLIRFWIVDGVLSNLNVGRSISFEICWLIPCFFSSVWGEKQLKNYFL